MAGLRLPEPLLRRLQVNVRLYRTTELKLDLAEIRTLGPAGTQLADELQALLDAGDLGPVAQRIHQLKPAPDRGTGTEPQPPEVSS